MWAGFVELLRAAIFAAAHVCGGSLGGGILLVSAGVRLALLPLTLRLARRARDQQANSLRCARRWKPCSARYANDPDGSCVRPERFTRSTASACLRLGTRRMAIQFPSFGRAFRRGAHRPWSQGPVSLDWRPPRPDRALLLVATALTAWSISSAPNTPGQTTSQTPLLVVGLLATAAFLWTASSAVALSAGRARWCRCCRTGC